MVSVSDPYHLLLALSFLAVLIIIIAGVRRENEYLVRIVVSFLFGFIVVFWWNSTVPDVLDLSNPFYFFLVSCLSALVVYGIWHQLGGLLATVGVGAALFALLVVGKDKLSASMGGLTDWELTGIGIAVMVTLIVMLWVLQKQTTLWVLCSNVFMGMGLALSLDVITQENPLQSFSNTDLDLIEFTSDSFLSILVVSITTYLILYYRHVIAPCWFMRPSPVPSPPSETRTEGKKPHHRDWQSLFEAHYSRLATEP